MTFLIYLFSFLILISVIVFVHELGHYLFARLFGVRILDFSIGFGKSIKSWQTKSKTVFNLRILPIGGYVKMNGEENSNNSDVKDSFSSKKYYQKLLITLGGPIFNFILALAIFFVINLAGVYKVTPLIGDILPNSLAGEAGIKAGDIISKIDNSSIDSFSEAQLALSKRLGDSGEIEVTVQREERSLEFYLKITDWLSSEEPSNLLYSIGVFPPLEPSVGKVLDFSPADNGGIKKGDKILEIQNVPINFWSDIKKEVNKSKGQEILLKILRNERAQTIKIKPALSEENFNWQVGISLSLIHI